MSLQITVRPQAELDLLLAAEFIAGDNPDAARRLLIAAREEFKRLSDYPYVGKPCNFRTYEKVRRAPIREFENYLIFCASTNTDIQIIRVLHGDRDWQGIFDE